MSKENNIRKGMLSEKMGNFHAEPPAEAWGNISSQLSRGGSRKVFLIVLAAAAGLALAITVGINLIERAPEDSIAEEMKGAQIQPENQHDQESTPSLQESTDIQEMENKSSRLEEKVQVAVEEVIREIEEDVLNIDQQDQVVLAEQIEETPDFIAEDQETTVDNEEAALEDQEIEIVDQQQNEIANDTEEINLEYSQRYLDSLSNAAIPDDVIISSIEKEQKKWQLGASLTPLFSYRDASSPDQSQNMAANNSESGVLAYSGGLQVSYAQSKRLSFETGLYYNKMGLAIGDFNTYQSNMDFTLGAETFTDNSIVSMSNSIGTISTSSADVVVNAWANSRQEAYYNFDSKEMTVQNELVNSFEQSLNYLEIPFNVKYKILDKNLKVMLIGGISTNLLVGNHVLANTANGKMDYGSVQDIRTVNYSGNAGLGFVYEFPGNFSLSLEPRFRYYINSVNEDYLPVTHPYALGVYTGVNYTF